ncbi:MAG: 16S rRNA (guanine(527)-N(7))-methyltransferase RsmG [Candidatus Fimimonas sp.]
MKDFIFQQTGIQLSETMLRQFELYCDFLLAENEKYNLTAITEPSAVWQKHFADSILGSVCLPQNATLCDIGSGAGFPSLPLKIARPDVDVTLVDSLEKRIAFTQTLCQKLNVSATFFHSRAEDFAKTHREAFDVATARAVAPLPVLLEYTAQIVKIGGIVLAYKTDLSEVDEAQNACKTLGLQFAHHKEFCLPDGSRRCLLVFSKTSSTPPKYPRGQNKPRKQPL